MIHLLEITSELTPPQLRKLARRYAMTGGYEMSIAKGVDKGGLVKIFEMYKSEIPAVSEEMRDSHYRSSNSYRVLRLVCEHEQAPSDLKIEIEKLL